MNYTPTPETEAGKAQWQADKLVELKNYLQVIKNMQYLNSLPDNNFFELLVNWFWAFVNYSAYLNNGSSWFTNRPSEDPEGWKYTTQATYGIYHIEASFYQFGGLYRIHLITDANRKEKIYFEGKYKLSRFKTILSKFVGKNSRKVPIDFVKVSKTENFYEKGFFKSFFSQIDGEIERAEIKLQEKKPLLV